MATPSFRNVPHVHGKQGPVTYSTPSRALVAPPAPVTSPVSGETSLSIADRTRPHDPVDAVDIKEADREAGLERVAGSLIGARRSRPPNPEASPSNRRTKLKKHKAGVRAGTGTGHAAQCSGARRWIAAAVHGRRGFGPGDGVVVMVVMGWWWWW